MADISKITPPGSQTTYNLKDATAREQVATKIGASDYATQNTGGTVRVWTTTSGGETTLHIANEAPTP